MKTPSARQLLITYVPSILILLAMVAVSALAQVRMRTLTSDVTTVASIHPLSGFLSNLGIVLWCATAAICAFAATILATVKRGEMFWFLLSSAVLTAFLLFDDLFQFHEALAAWYLGLSETAIFASWGIALAAYLVAFRRAILRSDFILLLLALGFLGVSVFIDAAVERWLLGRLGDWEYFLEDGLKWLGIASWCSYYIYTSYQLIANASGQPHYASQPAPGN